MIPLIISPLLGLSVSKGLTVLAALYLNSYGMTVWDGGLVSSAAAKAGHGSVAVTGGISIRSGGVSVGNGINVYSKGIYGTSMTVVGAALYVTGGITATNCQVAAVQIVSGGYLVTGGITSIGGFISTGAMTIMSGGLIATSATDSTALVTSNFLSSFTVSSLLTYYLALAGTSGVHVGGGASIQSQLIVSGGLSVRGQ